ncbi:MAG TPA: hypothetical protein VGY98_04840 [Verrucomicrobiae bacterium]|nr:hypothetical protein [Verrucomicrobiae bacterium]
MIKAPGMAEQTITEYRYDEAGNEIAQIDALNRTNTFAYDGMGRKILHTLPGMGSESHQAEAWAYDLDGNQITHTNFRGWVAYSMYDGMNRLTNRFGPDGWRGTEYDYYTYTPTGERQTMKNNESGLTVTNVYDSRDRLQKKIMSWGNDKPAEALNYGSDANGNVASIDSGFANGVHLAYSYDPLNRLTNVLSHGQLAAAYSYDLAGNLQALRYGNGVTNQYQYDSLNRLTNLVWNYNNSSRATSAYALKGGGTRTNLVESINNGSPITYEWGFDNLYRLTNENIGVMGNVAYAYDPVGNRTNQASSISSDSYTYDTNDEVLTDGNGNNPSYNGDGDLAWVGKLLLG